MANSPARIKQAEVTRYAKGLRAAGIEDFRIVVDPATGKYELIAGPAAKAPDANPCDRLLK